MVALVVTGVGCALPACEFLPRSPSAEPAGLRAEPLLVRAEEAAELGDNEQALQLLAAAIERNPTLTIAHMKMGEIYRMRGDNAQAERAYAAAARLEPRNFDAQYFHGLTLHLLNRLGDAVRAYLRALAIQPDSFEANLNVATAYLQLNEPRQSLPYAERAVELEPTSGPAHANLGAVLGALENHADAVREYQAAAELMELSPELLLNLADSLGKLRRFDEMANTLNAAIEMSPTSLAWERLGYARFKLREYEGAREAFREAIELDPRHYPALNGLGVVLLNDYLASDRRDRESKEEAIRLFQRSLQINKRQTRILELVTRFRHS